MCLDYGKVSVTPLIMVEDRGFGELIEFDNLPQVPASLILTSDEGE